MSELNPFIDDNKRTYTWQEFIDTFMGGKDLTKEHKCPHCGCEFNEDDEPSINNYFPEVKEASND